MKRVPRAQAVMAATVIVAGISSVSLVSSAQSNSPPREPDQSGSPDEPSHAGEPSQPSGQEPNGANSQSPNQPGSDTSQANPGQSANDSTPAEAEAQLVMTTATIKAVNRNGRELTLQDAQGKTIDVKVGPNVNIDRLRVGDRVDTAYYQEVAMAITKPGQPAPKVAESETERGGVTAQQSTITARILSVDANRGILVVRGPHGGTHTLEVKDPDLKSQLAQFKPGQNMSVTYTEAVAVQVEPSKTSK